MDGYMYDVICKKVKEGKSHMILHVDKNQSGVVLMWNRNDFNVKIGGVRRFIYSLLKSLYALRNRQFNLRG